MHLVAGMKKVLEMPIEAEMEWAQIYTCRPSSRKLGRSLGGWDLVHSELPIGGRNQERVEMYLEAELKWMQGCTWRLWSSEPWSSEIGGVLAVSRLEVCRVLPFHSSFGYSNSQPWEWNKVTVRFSADGKQGGGSKSCKEVCRMLKLHSQANYWLCQWREHGESWVDGVPGGCWIQWVLYSVCASHSGNSWSYNGMIVRDHFTLYSGIMVE